MRPDEHKKKKNAAYKKKHGIGKGMGEDEGTGKQKNIPKGKTGGERSVTSKNDLEKNKTHNGAQDKQLRGRDSSLSGSEDEGAKPQRKTFQRRQIVSNWQKYEIEPENIDQLEPKGESYEKLLSRAGDASSHFRLKDEQDWDFDATQSNEEDDNSGEISQYLNIDAKHLGQTLSCLPLYQVLGVPPDIFPKSELDSIHEHAALQRKLNMTDMSEEDETCSKEFSAVIPIPNHSQLRTKANHDLNSRQLAKTLQNQLVINSTHASNPTHQDMSDTKTTPVHSIQKTGAETPHDRLEQTLSLADDDLDALLGFDSTDCVLKQPSGRVDQADLNFAPEKSGIQALRRPAGADSELSACTSKTVQEPKKDGVDLEDWLDSILDD